MKLLFLDDDEERHTVTAARWTDLVAVRSVAEFKAALETAKEPFAVVSLDHDLEDFHYGCYDEHHERTGLDAAKLLTQLPSEKRPELVIVHSWNPIGARRMVQELEKAGLNVIYQPFDYVL